MIKRWVHKASYAVVFGYFKFSTVIEMYMTSYASFSIVGFLFCFLMVVEDWILLFFLNLERHQIHGIEVVFLILDVRKFTVKYMTNFNNSFIHSFVPSVNVR